jgi:transcription elongation factor Elf1
MGKRKSRTVQAKGPVAKVATVFDCPYCSRRETVEIKIAKKEGVGKLFCRVCSVGYQMRLGPLTKPVDIYCEWIDNADKLNQKQKSLGL